MSIDLPIGVLVSSVLSHLQEAPDDLKSCPGLDKVQCVHLYIKTCPRDVLPSNFIKLLQVAEEHLPADLKLKLLDNAARKAPVFSVALTTTGEYLIDLFENVVGLKFSQWKRLVITKQFTGLDLLSKRIKPYMNDEQWKILMDWASSPDSEIRNDLFRNLLELSRDLDLSSLIFANEFDSLRLIAEGRTFYVDTRMFAPADQSVTQLQEYQPVKLMPGLGCLTLGELQETKASVSDDLESAVSVYHLYSRVCPSGMKPSKFVDIWKRVRDHCLGQEELASDPLIKFVFSNENRLFVNVASAWNGSQLFDFLRCLAPDVKPVINSKIDDIIDVVLKMSEVAPYISDEDLLSLKRALEGFNDMPWLKAQDKQMIEYLAGKPQIGPFFDSFKYHLIAQNEIRRKTLR